MKPYPEGYILYDFIDKTFWKWLLPIWTETSNQKTTDQCLLVRMEEGIDNERVSWRSFLADQRVLCGNELVETWFYAIFKTHGIVNITKSDFHSLQI